jgi:ParB family transcriptional regulator, chromosome partitioning protein
MKRSQEAQAVEMIPVDRITVINPRVRNKKIFNEIISNIGELGLKKPITVTRRADADGPRYDLVCGQGRLEAYQALDQHEIPALVVDADTEDCLIMSLVENLARRQHRAIDLLHDIEGLKKRGYNDSTIARKTGLTIEYVKGVLRLLQKGELRLLRAVEAGQIPVSIAVEIAAATETETQAVLQQAYERKLLRGRKLIAAKRLIEQRQRRGKGLKINRNLNGQRRVRPLSSNALIRAYQEDVDRKRLLIRKAETTRNRLIFVTEAVRKLLIDENFLTLLQAEGLDTLPRNLAARIEVGAQT